MLVTSWTATTTATATKKKREEKKNHYFSCPFNFACCCCCCWSSHMHVASVWSFVQTPYIHSVCAQFTMLIFFFRAMHLPSAHWRTTLLICFIRKRKEKNQNIFKRASAKGIRIQNIHCICTMYVYAYAGTHECTHTVSTTCTMNIYAASHIHTENMRLIIFVVVVATAAPNAKKRIRTAQ